MLTKKFISLILNINYMALMSKIDEHLTLIPKHTLAPGPNMDPEKRLVFSKLIPYESFLSLMTYD